MSVFGDRLKTLRQKTGITQKELASKLNVSPAAYSLWEKGEREPKFEIIENLCTFFGVTTDFLMGRTDDIRTGNQILKDICRVLAILYTVMTQNINLF